MAERRSSRSKKVVDYAKFTATEENDDDFEEFKAQPTKRAKMDTKVNDDVGVKTPKNEKLTSENRIENSQEEAPSVKQSRLPLEEKILQRQIKQALEVSKSDIDDDEANVGDGDKQDSSSNYSSDEEDSSEDEFKPSKKQGKKAPAPVKKKIAKTVEKAKVSKEEETTNDVKNPEEKSNATELVTEKEDVKDEHKESSHNGHELSNQSNSQSSDESSEPSEESSNHSSDEGSSNDEEFQPVKKQAKKANTANMKAKSPPKAQHVIPKKEANGTATPVANGVKKSIATKPVAKKANEPKKDTTAVKNKGGSIASVMQPTISNNQIAIKRKGPLNSPTTVNKHSIQLPSKGIRIGLSRKIPRKPLHPSFKPQL